MGQLATVSILRILQLSISCFFSYTDVGCSCLLSNLAVLNIWIHFQQLQKQLKNIVSKESCKKKVSIKCLFVKFDLY